MRAGGPSEHDGTTGSDPDELQGSAPADLEAALREIKGLAERAQREKTSILMWNCL